MQLVPFVLRFRPELFLRARRRRIKMGNDGRYCAIFLRFPDTRHLAPETSILT